MAECYISKKDWKTIINYAQASYDEFKAEIGGMAIVCQDKDGDWIVSNPVILKQEVTSGSTSICKDELAKYYTKTGMKHHNKEFRFCWWHSHHNMGAFWSKTDTDTIDEYKDGDLSFALVVCLNGDYKFRVSMWKPFTSHQDMDLHWLGDNKKATVPNKIVNEVKELCSEPVSRWKAGSTKPYSNTYSGYYRSSDQQTALFGLEEVADQRVKEANSLIEKQGVWQDQLIDGELVYTKYTKKIQELNTELEKRGSSFRVHPFTDPVGDDMAIYSALPDAYVFEVDKDGKPIVDPEMDEWNASFGVY